MSYILHIAHIFTQGIKPHRSSINILCIWPPSLEKTPPHSTHPPTTHINSNNYLLNFWTNPPPQALQLHKPCMNEYNTNHYYSLMNSHKGWHPSKFLHPQVSSYPSCLISKLPHLQVSSSPSCLIPKLPNLQVASSPSCLIPMLPHPQVASFPSCLFLKLPHHQVASFP